MAASWASCRGFIGRGAAVVALAAPLGAAPLSVAAPSQGRPGGARVATSLAVFPEGVLAAPGEYAQATKGEAPALTKGEAPTAGEGTPATAPPDEGVRPAPEPEPSLDFDLLGEPEPPAPPAASGRLRLRRRMLTAHQGIGLGLLGLQLATTVVGQLNYSDRFEGGPSTARYQRTHAYLAYATAGVFAVNGLVALLAPSASKPRRLDRVMVHRFALFAAALAMAGQVALGIHARDREGYLDQERVARSHLFLGYATLALVAGGVAALVF